MNYNHQKVNRNSKNFCELKHKNRSRPLPQSPYKNFHQKGVPVARFGAQSCQEMHKLIQIKPPFPLNTAPIVLMSSLYQLYPPPIPYYGSNKQVRSHEIYLYSFKSSKSLNLKTSPVGKIKKTLKSNEHKKTPVMQVAVFIMFSFNFDFEKAHSKKKN